MTTDLHYIDAESKTAAQVTPSWSEFDPDPHPRPDPDSDPNPNPNPYPNSDPDPDPDLDPNPNSNPDPNPNPAQVTSSALMKFQSRCKKAGPGGFNPDSSAAGGAAAETT